MWVTTGDHIAPGKVVSRHSAPRSYVVETQTGEVRHNRQHLTEVPYDSLLLNLQESDDDPNELDSGIHSRSPIQTRSKRGVLMLTPDRLSY